MSEPTSSEALPRRASLSLIELGTPSEVCDRRARLSPGEVGLVSDDTALTWGEVKRLSDGLAAALLARGAGRQTYGVTFLPNSVDLFLVRLAAEKAGLPLALVPPSFGAAELSAICRRLRPTIAFVASGEQGFDAVRVMAEAAAGALRLVAQAEGPTSKASGAGRRTDGAAATAARDPLTLPLAELAQSGASAAFGAGSPFAATRLRLHEGLQLSPTSGSTGTPRCVRTSAYARGMTGCAQAERWELGADDVVAALTPIVAGTSEALAYHAAPRFARRIVLVGRFRAEEVPAIIERHGASVITAVPTMLARLAALDLPADRAGRRSLRVVVSFGAPLASELARAVEAATGARIVQAFGTSDHGGVAASHLADPPEVRWRSVGRPLDGNEVELRAADGRPAGPGRPGRLHVRGPHLFDGDETTGGDAGDAGGGRPWHVLDDLARLDDAGRLHLMGRTDDVIIRGGQNIFPGDVEELLLGHPAVAEAVVVGLPDAEMGQRVCACVVARSGASPRGEELLEFLRGAGLARFKLPERFAVLEALPRTANGLKVNRRALVERLLAGGGH